MTTASSALIPIFRSEAQARILASLLLRVSLELPIVRLVPVAGTTQPNVLREVNRLVEAGLLSERRRGNARMVRANVDNPHFQSLSGILRRSYGPIVLVPPAFESISGWEQLIAEGQWAQRYLGLPGPTPTGLDLVAVAVDAPESAGDVGVELERSLGMPVATRWVSREQWAIETAIHARGQDEPGRVLLVRR